MPDGWRGVATVLETQELKKLQQGEEREIVASVLESRLSCEQLSFHADPD